MILAALFGMLLCDSLRLSKPEKSVDVVELNHRYDETGRHCYSQVIVWEWMPDYRRYRAKGFVLVQDGSLSGYPLKRGDTYYIYRDGGGINPTYRLKSKVMIETWTDYDPEREANKINGGRP